MSGETDRLNYTEYRIYGYRKYGHTDVTLDLLDVDYGEAISGVKNAYSLTLAASYELSERMKLGADVEYSKNPDFDRDITTFVKLTYNFDISKEYHAAPVPVHEAPKPAAEQTPAVTPAQDVTKPAVEQIPAVPTVQSSPTPAPEQGTRKEGTQ
jgi:hypothetical protein